jgi:Phage capsid protein
VFQTVGKGSASTKARHGMVPVMNVDHTPVECQLQDFYAGDWVDHLDELKVNIDERQVLANAGAFALGRKTDEISTSTQPIARTARITRPIVRSIRFSASIPVHLRERDELPARAGRDRAGMVSRRTQISP